MDLSEGLLLGQWRRLRLAQDVERRCSVWLMAVFPFGLGEGGGSGCHGGSGVIQGKAAWLTGNSERELRRGTQLFPRLAALDWIKSEEA